MRPRLKFDPAARKRFIDSFRSAHDRLLRVAAEEVDPQDGIDLQEIERMALREALSALVKESRPRRLRVVRDDDE